MTITYSIWQGSRLLSIDNIAHEIKAVDHLISSLNESDLGKKTKFSANIQKIEVTKWHQQCMHTHAIIVEIQELFYLMATQHA
jgi:heme oxygenase